MGPAERAELKTRLRRFVNDEDRSKDFVAELEGFFIEHGLHDHQQWARLGVALASYGPASVEPGLYEEAAMVSEFKDALHDLHDHDFCTHPPLSAMEAYLGRVQVTIWETDKYLSRQAVERAQHLVDHGEPAEGMLSLAWAVVSEGARVPESLIAAIRSHAADLVPEDCWPTSLGDHSLADNDG